MSKDWVHIILYAITVVFALVGIVMVAYMLLGHSPTLEEGLLVFAVATITLLINHMRDTGKFKGHARAELAALRRDMEEVKRDLKLLTSKRIKVT